MAERIAAADDVMDRGMRMSSGPFRQVLSPDQVRQAYIDERGRNDYDTAVPTGKAKE